NKAARQRLIDALRETNPTLYQAFQEALRDAETASKLVREGGRFPLTAVGDVNVYALFAEHGLDVLHGRGRAGIIVPTGIATDDTTRRFFGHVVNRGALATLFDIENRENIFEGVGHGRYKFCLLTLSGHR